MQGDQTWNDRPKALLSNFAALGYKELFQHYVDDGKTAQKRQHQQEKGLGSVQMIGSTLRHKNIPLPSSSLGTAGMMKQPTYLRTCQWNIHTLSAQWESQSNDHVTKVANTMIESNPHVIILNEYSKSGFDDCSSRSYESRSNKLRLILESKGYKLFGASCSYPTVIATCLPVKRSGKFRLDSKRAAVYVEVCVNDIQLFEEFEDKYVTIFGTHLEAWDINNGSWRLSETETLLNKIEELSSKWDIDENKSHNKSWGRRTNNKCVGRRTLIVGDLNQQRQSDYTRQEWEAVCESKEKRDSPSNDGVARLLKSCGFRCFWDHKKEDFKCNWNLCHPPPATHWTSTIVDYSYFRGLIDIDGINVSPSNLSDHRLIISDWRIK